MFHRMTFFSLEWAASRDTKPRQNKVHIRTRHKRTTWILTHLRSYGRNIWLLENLKKKCRVHHLQPKLCFGLFCFFLTFFFLQANHPIHRSLPDKTDAFQHWVPLMSRYSCPRCYNVRDYIQKKRHLNCALQKVKVLTAAPLMHDETHYLHKIWNLAPEPLRLWISQCDATEINKVSHWRG